MSQNSIITVDDSELAKMVPLGNGEFMDDDGNVFRNLGPEIGGGGGDFDDDDEPEVGRRRRNDDDDRNIFQKVGDRVRQGRQNRLENVGNRLDERQSNRDENRAERNGNDDDNRSSSPRRAQEPSRGGVWMQHSLTVKFTNATTAEATSTESVTSQSLFVIDTFTTDGSVTGAVMGTAYIGDEPVMNTGGNSTPFAVFANQNDRSKGQLSGREIGPGIYFKATATLPAAASTTAPVYGFITLLGRRWVPAGCA